MKTLVRCLALSLMLSSVSFVSIASSRGHSSEGHRQNKERSYSRPGKGNNHNNVRPSAPQRQHKADRPAPQPQHKPEARPAPQPRHGRPVAHRTPPPPRYSPVYDTLSQMVINTIGGGQMLDLWQISEDAYMLKYRIGNRYYSRYLYPYSGRYGTRSQISLNWTPSSFLSLIPAINLNINL